MCWREGLSRKEGTIQVGSGRAIFCGSTCQMRISTVQARVSADRSGHALQVATLMSQCPTATKQRNALDRGSLS